MSVSGTANRYLESERSEINIDSSAQVLQVDKGEIPSIPATGVDKLKQLTIGN